MTPTELRTRVVREAGAGVLLLALIAGWLGGAPGFVGVAAAGAITVVNFWWLARGASATLGAFSPGSGASPACAARGGAKPSAVSGAWIVASGLRFLALLAAFAALCATGWAHPVAVVAGLTVLPCAVIALGLRAARD
jgi:ATP synthase I chain